MVYGYARVSTRTQATDGNSMESQEQALFQAGAIEIHKDVATGSKLARPGFDVLLSRMGPGDMLVVTKLDRIARSLNQGSELINQLINNGIRVHILNIGIMDNSPSSKLIRNIFFAFAEFEKDMIIERTQEGKAIAKTKENYVEGRPKKFTQEQLKHALKLLEDYSYKEVVKMTRISKSTLIRAKNSSKP